ncbi:hypothetical protein BDQ17DRAFT_1395132 [Cyathus striatus]|nr:hypothetical protein BDQ17DRAFT_1395132 [Cyathus striatus]
MGWQKTFTLSKRAKGCHLVTDEVLTQVQPGLHGVQTATSAALTVNENFDKVKCQNMDMALDNIVPESLNWRHTDEGPDVAHWTHRYIPVTNGQLNLGTWQGIYLTEFRHIPHTRRVVATILCAHIIVIQKPSLHI